MSQQSTQYNLILSGIGGQGLITLLKIIAEAALLESKDFKSSELHGLSQRGGSVKIHIRVGKNIHSPLIGPGEASLILALETQEALASLLFASEETHFLVNKFQTPTMAQSATAEEVKKELESISPYVKFIPASEICKEKLGNPIVDGEFMLGYAIAENLLPFQKQSLIKAIKKIIPEKYVDLNIKAFKLGSKKAKA